jgi:hypothetical protein
MTRIIPEGCDEAAFLSIIRAYGTEPTVDKKFKREVASLRSQ